MPDTHVTVFSIMLVISVDSLKVNHVHVVVSVSNVHSVAEVRSEFDHTKLAAQAQVISRSNP